MSPKEPQRGRRPRRNEALINRDIEIYKCQMRGESVRAIGEKFGIKSTNSVVCAIARGKENAKVKGIDVEEHRLEINELLRDTIGLVARQVQHQATHGLLTEMVDADGNTMTKRVAGIDPRLAAELGRSATRWAEFLGLMDTKADAAATQSTTVVLTAPAAGADFESRYGGQQLQPSADQQTIDTQAVPVKETVVSEGGPGWGAEPSDS